MSLARPTPRTITHDLRRGGPRAPFFAGGRLRGSLAPALALALVLALAACDRGGDESAPPPAAPAAPAQESPIKRTVLQQRDVPELPGWETRLILIEYAPGVAAPPHHHPEAGLGYVLSGQVESAFEGGPLAAYQEGESFTDDAVVEHTVSRNADPARTLRLLVAYTIRKDTPNVIAP